MPTSVNGSPANQKPHFDVSFRFNDAAFDALTTEQKDAEVDAAALRILGYVSGSTGDDPDGADEVFPIPDLRNQAYNISVSYARDYTAEGIHFTFEVRFVDDPSQTTGIPAGQVKARISDVVDDVVAEITQMEADTGYTVAATVDWL